MASAPTLDTLLNTSSKKNTTCLVTPQWQSFFHVICPLKFFAGMYLSGPSNLDFKKMFLLTSPERIHYYYISNLTSNLSINYIDDIAIYFPA